MHWLSNFSALTCKVEQRLMYVTLEEVVRTDGVTIHLSVFCEEIRLFDLRGALPSLRWRTSGIILRSTRDVITISFTDST